ncbi:MAG: hypothetical protein V1928_03375 [Parcubacteria group bacterium]
MQVAPADVGMMNRGKASVAKGEISVEKRKCAKIKDKSDVALPSG